MKTLVISDVHGRTIWKDIIKKETSNIDRIVFLGDYVDSFDISPEQQRQVLEEVFEFKKTSEKPVILLIGNHDLSYIPVDGQINPCSGYQPYSAPKYEEIYEKNKEHLQACFVDEHGVIYSHAGISTIWLKDNNIEYQKSTSQELGEYVNKAWKTNPKAFWYNVEDRSGYGQHPAQSPTWIRPRTLVDYSVDALQIVGHTRVRYIDHPPKGIKIYLVDNLEDQTNPYYITIEKGVVTIHRLTEE